MLTELVTSQTRVSLLIKFFLNKDIISYLRELERNLKESGNSIRVELSNLENLNLILSFTSGNKKYYRVNVNHEYFHDIRNLLLKELGFERIKNNLMENIDGLSEILVVGDYANGIQSHIIDLALLGEGMDKVAISERLAVIEFETKRKIRFFTVDKIESSKFLINTQMFRI